MRLSWTRYRLQAWLGTKPRELGRVTKTIGDDLPPFSRPFTAASETFRSTALRVSFAASTADFCARTEVEKVAREVCRVVRNAVAAVLVRKDMMVDV